MGYDVRLKASAHSGADLVDSSGLCSGARRGVPGAASRPPPRRPEPRPAHPPHPPGRPPGTFTPSRHDAPPTGAWRNTLPIFLVPDSGTLECVRVCVRVCVLGFILPTRVELTWLVTCLKSRWFGLRSRSTRIKLPDSPL